MFIYLTLCSRYDKCDCGRCGDIFHFKRKLENKIKRCSFKGKRNKLATRGFVENVEVTPTTL
jgi:hypothetical protein